DEVGATVELIDDFEYRFLALRGRSVHGEKHSNSQVRRRPQLWRNHGVGRLLHPIVKESVRVIRAKYDPGTHGFPEVLVKLLDRLVVGYREHVEFGAIPHAGELPECLLRLR